ncbi:hypothetical protein NRB20_38340 [Nocardia sp. RB20]|uniref:Uncharacterized protein n=1 Tax=Nocardia macrotermitis TaxID=2585198 RepID=A0A7K0D4P9_9NOCA|nr:hypothetical protein [Nocardia macrotermitis]
MSYIVNTSVAPFCHSQNHSGSVPVSAFGVTAFGAEKSPRTKVEVLLGSRETSRTCDRRMRRLNQHHRTTGTYSSDYEFSLGLTDGRVGGLTRHRRLGQEPRPKVFHGDDLVSNNNPLRPYPSIVAGLTRSFLPQPGDLVLRAAVTTGRHRTVSMTSRHSALRSCQLGSTALAIPAIGEIVSGVSSCSRRTNSPVDADGIRHSRQRLGLPLDHERGVPGAKTVLENPHAGWLTRQLPRPYNRNREALRQAETPIPKTKPASGVLQGQMARLARLELWASPARNLERFVQSSCVGTQSLLLSNLGTFTQPTVPTAGCGQQLAQLAECRFQPRLVLMHSLIPNEAAAVRFRNQFSSSDNSRTDPVVVAHCLDHMLKIPRTTDMKYPVNEIPPTRVTDVSR